MCGTHTCKIGKDRKVKDALTVQFESAILRSDSQVVLAWLQTEPNLLKLFVTNRVVRVQEMAGTAIWRYVPTKSNPAELLSRGVLPRELINVLIWWTRPEWLTGLPSDWPTDYVYNRQGELPERKTRPTLTVTIVKPIITWAWCLRFVSKLKCRESRRSGPLTIEELHQTALCLAKITQQASYRPEITDLARASSNLAALFKFGSACTLYG